MASIFDIMDYAAVIDDDSSQAKTDNALAWNDIINDALAADGGEIEIPIGTVYGFEDVGTIVDALAHNVKEIDLSGSPLRFLTIKGKGSHLTKIVCNVSDTPSNPGVNVTRPILKTRNGVMLKLSGLTIHGGINHQSEIGGSLSTGADPYVASMVEARNTLVVLEDVVWTGFAQNKDTSDNENGNLGRTGPCNFVDCIVQGKIELAHPTYREGCSVFDCKDGTKFDFKYIGPATNDINDKPVSTPLHIWGPNTGSWIIGDFFQRGAYRGSLINMSSPKSGVIKNLDWEGNIGTINDTTGDARTSPGTDAWGKGPDDGSEHNEDLFPSYPQGGRLVLENIIGKNAWGYGIRAIRQPGYGGTLILGNINIKNCQEGINIRNYDRVHFGGNVVINDCLHYAGHSNSNGYAIKVTDVPNLSGMAIATGKGTAVYDYPYASTPSTGPTTRYSKTGFWFERCSGEFTCIVDDFKEQHLYAPIDTTEHNTYSLKLNIHSKTDLYVAPPVSTDNFIAVGSASNAAFKNLSIHGTFNGKPLIESGQISFYSVSPVEGIQAITLGSFQDNMAEDGTIGIIRFWNPDISNGLTGIRGQIRAVADDGNGRGAALVYETSTSTGAMQENVRMEGDSSIILKPRSSAPTASEGKIYVDSATNKFRGYINGAWRDFH